MDKMAALCVAIACNSNAHRGQLQTRRKSYETKRIIQPLPQARIQASAEGITPTNLPPRSRISQRSSLQNLDSQVKRYAEDKAPTPSPSFNSQFCCPSSELRQHTSFPLTVNLHTPSLSYIHSPLAYQSLPLIDP